MQSTAASAGPTLWNHLRNLGLACGYLMFLAVIVAMSTGRNVWLTAAALFAVAMLMSIITLLLIAQKALAGDGRQFGLSSIFIAVVGVAVYMGLLRWLLASDELARYSPAQAWVVAVIASVPGIFFTLPFVFLLSETLIWTAVKLVKLPRVRAWLRDRRKRRGGETSNEPASAESSQRWI